MLTKQVIHDSDPGPDDLSTSMLILPGRKSLVLTCYGCGSVEDSTRNAAGFLSLLDLPDAQLIKGAAGPLQQHPIAGDNLPRFFGSNGLNNIELSESGLEYQTDASNSVFEFLKQGQTTYFLTGPCTNLAKLLLADADFVKSRIERIFMMGGALRTRGNEGPKDAQGNQWAEFNFYLDPKAANIVLASGIPISLVTWDAAQAFKIKRSEVQKIKPNGEASGLIVDSISKFFELYSDDKHSEAQQEPAMILSDVLTYMDASDQRLTTRETIKVRVSEEFNSYGRLIEDRENGHAVQYVTLNYPMLAQLHFIKKLEN